MNGHSPVYARSEAMRETDFVACGQVSTYSACEGLDELRLLAAEPVISDVRDICRGERLTEIITDRQPTNSAGVNTYDREHVQLVCHSTFSHDADHGVRTRNGIKW